MRTFGSWAWWKERCVSREGLGLSIPVNVVAKGVALP